MAHPVPTRDNTHTYSLAEDARRNVKSCKGFLAFSVPGNSAVEGCDFGLLCLHTAEVTGSIPVAPTQSKPLPRGGNAYAARALDLPASESLIFCDSSRYAEISESRGHPCRACCLQTVCYHTLSV